MHAVVTGGAGFIGSHVVDALVARGNTVSVIDTLITGRLANLQDAMARGVRLHRLDVRDAAAVSATVAAERPDLIVHLAAQIDVRVSVGDPALDADVNVLGTLAVLDAARAGGVGRLILTSTGGAIYGDAALIPTPETAPALPVSGYGQSKLCAEGYLALYARLHGLSAMALRFANVYGPRQRAEGEGGVVAVVCDVVRRGRPATIFGDGAQTRDFVYVDDVVQAILAAADTTATFPVNIGTGVETSVLHLIGLLRSLEARTPEPLLAPARAGEVRRSCLDPRLAEGVLGWRARTSLIEGLRRTYRATADDPELAANAGRA